MVKCNEDIRIKAKSKSVVDKIVKLKWYEHN